MEHRKRIVILDENRDFRVALERTLADKGYLIRISTSRADLALEAIRKGEADILVTDILLFGTDGADFVKKAATAAENGRPKILVCSLIKEPAIIEELFSYGVSDYVYKVTPMNVIAAHVDRLCPSEIRDYKTDENREVQKLEKAVTSLLVSLGMPIKLKGFHYIRYAVIKTLLSDQPSVGITKTVYPDLIKRYGATQKSAERAIRTAIEHIWNSEKKKLIEKLFSYTEETRPSNAAFIAMVTDRMRLYDFDCSALCREEYFRKRSV